MQKKMANEQATTNEAIAKTVAEETRVVIQAMASATAERPQSMAGPKVGRPATKQPCFNREADDRYGELKNFRFEVNNIIT